MEEFFAQTNLRTFNSRKGVSFETALMATNKLDKRAEKRKEPGTSRSNPKLAKVILNRIISIMASLIKFDSLSFCMIVCCKLFGVTQTVNGAPPHSMGGSGAPISQSNNQTCEHSRVVEFEFVTPKLLSKRMSYSIRFVVIMILCLQTKVSLAQNVIYTQDWITVHSIKTLSRDNLIKDQIDLVIKRIEVISVGSQLENKGIAYIENLNSLKNCWTDELDLMFNKLSHYTKRITKKGIRFLGRLLHELTSVPGPDQFDAQGRLIKDLLHLVSIKQNHSPPS